MEKSKAASSQDLPSKVEQRVDARQRALRSLPSVDELLALPAAQEAARRSARPLVVKAVRRVVDEVRRTILEEISQGEPQSALGEVWNIEGEDGENTWSHRLEEALRGQERRALGPVINATGVVLHTNLGRAPLSAAAIEAVARVARGYSNLEYDVVAGARGSRHAHGEELLLELTGAEAAMVVNNNAAAVLLVLSALASGKEVVLSRGELIEIGGSFRVPDVLAQSGCTLVEVGTTNRTHVKDYEAAIGPNTAALLKVHASNYKVIGFTKSVTAKELTALARQRGVYLIEDLGSGVLVHTERHGLSHEPTIQEAVASGADVVTCSGDKLLGGPQAGLILGRLEVVDRCRIHPLARALRVDKMTLAALQATLFEYARGQSEAVPIWRMMALDAPELEQRAHKVAEELSSPSLRGALSDSAPDSRRDGRSGGALEITVRESLSTVGGGSLPGDTLPTWVVCVRSPRRSPEALAKALRERTPPIVARIEDDAILLDLRTVDPGDDGLVARGISEALASVSQAVDVE